MLWCALFSARVLNTAMGQIIRNMFIVFQGQTHDQNFHFSFIFSDFTIDKTCLFGNNINHSVNLSIPIPTKFD